MSALTTSRFDPTTTATAAVCPGHPVGPHDTAALDEALDLMTTVPGWDTAGSSSRAQRVRGARTLLTWLISFPGEGWQQRWAEAGGDDSQDWLAVRADGDLRDAYTARQEIQEGANWLFLARIIRPGYVALVGRKTYLLARLLPAVRSPEMFARVFDSEAAARLADPEQLRRARLSLVKVLLHTGKGLDDLDGEDLLEFRRWQQASSLPEGRRGGRQLPLAWALLVEAGILPAGSTLRAMVRTGQRSIAELVDFYGVRDTTIRDVLIRYLSERAPALDYNSLRHLVHILAGLFWADIEAHNPGIDSLDLPESVALAWKQRLAHIERGGRVTERKSYFKTLIHVRAFYLDIADWARSDPFWVRFAVASPVRRGDTAGVHKVNAQTTARMNQRTRDRLPRLPVLVDAIGRHHGEQSSLLETALATPEDSTFTHAEITYRRIGHRGLSDTRRRAPSRIMIEDTSTGERIDVARREDEAFWAWAIIETLRHTGVRLEELLELTQLALVSYRMPKTGEVVPLLQIVPSKSNEERVLLVSPELASVLASIINRLRRHNDGHVPLVARYDSHERTTGTPLPHLFQRRAGAVPGVIAYKSISKLLNDAAARAGLRDAAGEPLRYTAHDFRRIFVTDAITGGLPIHIAAQLLGHRSITTTQGYHAVFADELVRTYRRFLDERRSVRPQAEYREPTAAEWREFEQHFEQRKLELGTCARPYGTPCQHEHACIRCPMLRVDPRQRGRLVEIAQNLTDRIAEARINGWLGEIEGLDISLNAAKRKLAELDRATTTTNSPTDLGLPAPPEQTPGRIHTKESP